MRGAHPFTLGSCHVSQTCHTNHTRIELAQISGRLHLLLEMCMLVLSLQTCLLHDGSFSRLPICHLRSTVLQQQRKHHSLLRVYSNVQVEPGTIWCFEQEHTLAGLNVATTIRMTVVKLQNGELLVYAPVAPTR